MDTTQEILEKQREATHRWQVKQRLYSGRPYVICQVCGEPFYCLHFRHLGMHGLTIEQYRAMFPGAPTQTNQTLDLRNEARWKRMYETVEPTTALTSFLTGSLLGDGGLERSDRRQARYKETAGNRDYLLWKTAFLTPFQTRWSEGDYLSSQTGKVYRRYRLATRTHPLLTDWYLRWYPSGKKIVCREDVTRHLDALAMAVWFYDDGHVSRVERNYSAFLYTLAFPTDDVDWLVRMITSRFAVACHCTRIGKHQAIRFPREGRDALLAMINQHPAPGMAYKLDAPQPKGPWRRCR